LDGTSQAIPEGFEPLPPLPVPPRPAGVSIPPPSVDAEPDTLESGSRAPGRGWLPPALQALATEDPVAAARLVVGMLPLQGLAATRPASYDLEVVELGRFGIDVEPGRLARVEKLDDWRKRKDAEFRLHADTEALVSLVSGAPWRRARRKGKLDARRGGRKARVGLAALGTMPLSFAVAARAGLALDVDLPYRVLAKAVDPAWLGEQEFLIAHEVTDAPGQVYVKAAGSRGLVVSVDPPSELPVATVRSSKAAVLPLVTGEPVPAGDKPALRGDAHALALLREWTSRAQRMSRG